jgi:crotonobetainyl-CoA:carnitine CoA-transferase CaiB-like acyl-CoA transferase
MSGPLAGIRVLEQSVFQQGPVAGSLLADMGADVVKIEGPASPDPGRWAFDIGIPTNPYFEHNNRNKRSLVIDFKNASALAAFYRMVGAADVFLTNLRLPAVERLGLSYAELSARNSRLVYGHGTGYGAVGPDADQGAFDLIAQARGGVMSANATPDGEPLQVGAPIADQIGGLLLAWGVLLALFSVQRTGKGQLVNSSILAGQLFGQGFQITHYLFRGQQAARPALARPERTMAQPLWNRYRAGDGTWFVIAQPLPQRWWPRLCQAIGRPELEHDPESGDIVTHPENCPRAVRYLDEVFATQDRRWWLARFRAIDLPCSPVADYEELVTDPQVLANELIVDYEHPAGRFRMAGLPVGLSETPGAIQRPAPEFGQHTEEVLLEYGFDWGEIEQLRAAGAIGPGADTDNQREASRV